MRKFKDYLSIVCVLFFCCTTQAIAIPISGLYQTAVPVASQSSAARQAALQQALTQVFIKVSGKSTVTKLAPVQSAIANPENYLLTYSYTNALLPDGAVGLYLRTKFDAKLLQNTLKKAGQNIWGENRPLVLIWVAITQQNTESTLLPAGNQNAFVQEFKNVAKQRGLPVVFPLLDLVDMRAVSPNDTLTVNAAKILQASRRYSSDAVLVVNLQQINNQNWNGVWTLLFRDTTTAWQTNGMTFEQAVNAGVNAITDNLAAKFSTSTVNTADVDVQLTVTNIKNLDDYAKVSQYLKGLSIVKGIEVNQVESSAVVYTITVAGGAAALEQALSLDHRLQPVTNTAAGTGSANAMPALVYQWLL